MKPAIILEKRLKISKMVKCTENEIRIELYKYFLQNDSINLREHSKKISIDCAENLKEFVIAPVLKKLEEEGVVFCASTSTEKWWVLVQNLNSIDRSVSIPFNTQITITEFLNHYAETTCNPMFRSNIDDFSASEIQKLIVLIDDLIKVSKKT